MTSLFSVNYLYKFYAKLQKTNNYNADSLLIVFNNKRDNQFHPLKLVISFLFSYLPVTEIACAHPITYNIKFMPVRGDPYGMPSTEHPTPHIDRF